ncbi:MAG: hypothetical protein PVJ95_02960 [Cellvibrionales bacterium]
MSAPGPEPSATWPEGVGKFPAPDAPPDEGAPLLEGGELLPDELELEELELLLDELELLLDELELELDELELELDELDGGVDALGEGGVGVEGLEGVLALGHPASSATATTMREACPALRVNGLIMADHSSGVAPVSPAGLAGSSSSGALTNPTQASGS